jgi:hypothetical protein
MKYMALVMVFLTFARALSSLRVRGATARWERRNVRVGDMPGSEMREEVSASGPVSRILYR